MSKLFAFYLGGIIGILITIILLVIFKPEPYSSTYHQNLPTIIYRDTCGLNNKSESFFITDGEDTVFYNSANFSVHMNGTRIGIHNNIKFKND
jgi:hypothetical protein